MTLEELRNALANATGPDAGLDEQIALALGVPPRTIFRGGIESDEWHPSYTGSVDAAITLVPQGWIFSIHTYGDGRAGGFLIENGSRRRRMPSKSGFDVATPAIALCLARVEYELQRAATPDEGRDG